MALYYLPKEGLQELLKKLYDWGELFWVRARDEGKANLEKANPEDIPQYSLPKFRGAQPVKSVLFPPKQHVADYPKVADKDLDAKPVRRAIFGITQCDLAGINIFDRVYLEDEEFVDPFYKKRRDGLFIATMDCSEALPSCFCNLVKGKPFAESGFDLNLTPVDGGFLVEAATMAGEDVLKGIGASAPTESMKSLRQKLRDKVSAQLEKQNKPFETEKGFIALVTENQEEPKSYDHHASTCVACGACTHICPGCFCFGLTDNPKEKGGFERSMTWDSCQFSGFSRMAGDMNPRGRLALRFMHRYNHKFFHYPWRYDGWPSCTGCGRCIDNCMGRIDMRATLRDLSVSDVSQMFPAPSPPPGENPAGR
jgi:formate hydrogenlyase subunit 6/NADH:ubiquinone oxidoreductase subunit I